jgi:hypothetical protein
VKPGSDSIRTASFKVSAKSLEEPWFCLIRARVLAFRSKRLVDPISTIHRKMERTFPNVQRRNKSKRQNIFVVLPMQTAEVIPYFSGSRHDAFSMRLETIANRILKAATYKTSAVLSYGLHETPPLRS